METTDSTSCNRKLNYINPFWNGLLGPGIVLLAFGQATGELIHWPNLVAKYGTYFLFLLIPACAIQYPMFVFLGRHTVLTGEGFFSSLIKTNLPLAIVTWLIFLLTSIWISSYTAAGGAAIVKLINAVFNVSMDLERWSNWTAIALNLYFFYVLFRQRHGTYNLIRKSMTIVAITSLCGISVLFVICLVMRGGWSPFFWGIGEFKFSLPESWDPRDGKLLISAFVFAGLGGLWNALYSYWVRGEKLGMAQHSTSDYSDYKESFEPIDSPATSVPAYHQTMSLLHRDLILGFIGNAITLLMLGYIVYALFPRGQDAPTGFGMITVLGDTIRQMGTFFGAIFYVFVGALLIDTWFTAADTLSKVHANFVIGVASKPPFNKAVKTWGSDQTLYRVFLVAMLGMTILSVFVAQPQQLIFLNGVLSALGSVVLVVCLLAVEAKLRRTYAAFGTPKVMLVFLYLCLIVYTAVAVMYFLA